MNILVMLLISLGAFAVAYYLYSAYIGRIFRASDLRPTPAVKQADGVDYVATPMPVLFSHHFATIAGAGPIVGPTIAAIYGIFPAWAWVVLGSIFIGAVHDYSSMLVSLRERGRSIAQVTGNLTGRLGFLLYIAFTLIMIVIVTAAFLDLSVQALTSVTSARLVQLPASNPFNWPLSVDASGAEQVRIGGIATASVIVMTLFAPLIGFLVFKRRWDTRLVGALALVVAAVSVWIGMYHPVSFSGLAPEHIRLTWMLILATYVLLASAVPVWLILQGRDFINIFTLIGGMLLLIVGCIVGGLRGMTIDPLLQTNIAEGAVKLQGGLWPLMFITIACGAISGFHALVTGGTSGKQCARESDARRVGFGGMLTEGMLAVLVLAALGAGLGHARLLAVQFPEGAAGNPVLAFSLAMGLLTERALGLPVYIGTIFGLLMVEGFIVTTLDTAVRLNRYLLEEFWAFIFKDNQPPLFKNYYFNALICVSLMLALAIPNGWKIIWPVFGTANQLLAALTLATVSIWLAYRARPAWFTLGPAAFMMATCLASLWQIMSAHPGKLAKLAQQLADGALTAEKYHSAVTSVWSVSVVSALLFLLSLGVIALCSLKLWELASGRRPRILDDPADAVLIKAPATGGGK